ncbi:MAG: hypothetical protein ACYS15_03920 [Planctomycetota bacterium]|jgi:hypothetical protein
MARKSQQAFAKRQRELKKAEKAAQKRLRREERKEAETNPAETTDPAARDHESPET